ncbi:hypothetical protein J7I98_23580 [Streptomyces sp. ISL-98]|uniref:hypothetical protein n=1 Tax=Streptomyces sp. ISL-98 TaxID=2819192 RepID=UPI001BE4FDD0|nr:hypothetical protein [Streptomyces sp. ISL-98]MBT2508812.1 hypothetical protein [Streptomyces sp. ISL-98]
MSTLISGDQLRTILYGTRVEKAYATLAVETKTLFNVTGGKVLITSITGEVTTAITTAGTSKLQANPTTGTTSDLVAATDLGTTDTPAGNILSFTGVKTDSIVHGPGSAPNVQRPIVVNTGTIEQVNATGADGGITWVLTYIPLDNGASVAAA